eukprot:5692823-Amphidinium_carterae.1
MTSALGATKDKSVAHASAVASLAAAQSLPILGSSARRKPFSRKFRSDYEHVHGKVLRNFSGCSSS